MKKLQKRALAAVMAFCLMLVLAFSTSFAATDALVVSKTQVSTGGYLYSYLHSARNTNSFRFGVNHQI